MDTIFLDADEHELLTCSFSGEVMNGLPVNDKVSWIFHISQEAGLDTFHSTETESPDVE